MRVGCLFAGIGGFELASQWMGWENIWSNEYDKHACKVLRKNFKHQIIEDDIKNLSGYKTNKREALAEVDIICGGFP